MCMYLVRHPHPHPIDPRQSAPQERGSSIDRSNGLRLVRRDRSFSPRPPPQEHSQATSAPGEPSHNKRARAPRSLFPVCGLRARSIGRSTDRHTPAHAANKPIQHSTYRVALLSQGRARERQRHEARGEGPPHVGGLSVCRDDADDDSIDFGSRRRCRFGPTSVVCPPWGVVERRPVPLCLWLACGCVDSGLNQVDGSERRHTNEGDPTPVGRAACWCLARRRAATGIASLSRQDDEKIGLNCMTTGSRSTKGGTPSCGPQTQQKTDVHRPTRHSPRSIPGNIDCLVVAAGPLVGRGIGADRSTRSTWIRAYVSETTVGGPLLNLLGRAGPPKKKYRDHTRAALNR